MLLTFENLSRILRLKPASQPQNLRAEPQKLEQWLPGLGGALGISSASSHPANSVRCQSTVVSCPCKKPLINDSNILYTLQQLSLLFKLSVSAVAIQCWVRLLSAHDMPVSANVLIHCSNFVHSFLQIVCTYKWVWYSTGWAKKTGLFLNVNNFFCVWRRKVFDTPICSYFDLELSICF